jgi:hypothetical protein
MNAIVLEREIETSSSLASVTLVLNAIRMPAGRPKRSGSRRAPGGVSANHGNESGSPHRNADGRVLLCLQNRGE